MPEFILDYGTPEAALAYSKLDEFTQGYIEAMFFTNAYDGDELEGYTVADLAPQTLAKIIEHCQRFQTVNAADLDEALDCGRIKGYDLKALGRDFWYTRCGHGVGFWDRGLGDIGHKLSELARATGNIDPYRGDDQLIYLS